MAKSLIKKDIRNREVAKDPLAGQYIKPEVGPDSLDGLFRPKAVAVVGASSTTHSIGRQILNNIVGSEYQGKVFPVNPKADVIHSIKCYPSVGAIPDRIDLAVIAAPRQFVPEIAEDCGKKGVKGLVVISAGFKEAGGSGVELERQTLAIVRRYGMRMVGPNCFGIVNTEPGVRLNSTFGKTFPERGPISFVSQSGALGEAIMVHAQEMRLGFSMIASVGNKADISSNDLLMYWAHDPLTEIILMYIESFGNPRKFVTIARELSRKKPIVVVKSGRTTQGARAASSHTGALAGMDVGVEALFEQAGVIRVDTVEQLFDVAAALTGRKIPRGKRVGIITNAGGPAILATDAMISLGMETPALSPATEKKLRDTLPPDINYSNPLDLIAGAGPKEFEGALRIMAADEEFDTIVPIFVPPITVNPLDVAAAMVNGLRGSSKPALACFMGVRSGSEGVRHLQESGLPVYKFPEAIAKTLERLAKYSAWLARKPGVRPDFRVDKSAAQKVFSSAQARGEKNIIGPEALAILRAYGIAVADYHIADSVETAIGVAKKLGSAVVMKINTPQLLHKTELGGVAVDLRSAEEIRAAFERMEKAVHKQGLRGKFSVALQEMIKGGVETVIGMSTDPTFGPLVMFGLGGVYVEIFKDVSFRIAPLSDTEALAMIHSVKSYPILSGARGSKSVDIKRLQETILRVSALISDFPQITEMDINPFIARPKGQESIAVDARIAVG